MGRWTRTRTRTCTWTWTWADPDVFRHFFHSTFFATSGPVFSHSMFCPVRHFFHSAFFPFVVLSHSAFCLSTFCHSTFCTFVICYFDILSVNPPNYSLVQRICINRSWTPAVLCLGWLKYVLIHLK